MLIDTQAVNQRLVSNDIYIHEKLAKPIQQILSAPEGITNEMMPDYEDWMISESDGWVVNGEPIKGALSGFVGIIDLETTGLQPKTDSIICAVGLGWIGDQPVLVAHGNIDRLSIEHSVIANINQPFDRSLYDIKNGHDTNLHIDLSSLAKMVLGSPDPTNPFSGYPSMKSLAWHYFKEVVDKSDRDELVAGNLNYEDTVRYCFRDVQMTVRLAKKIIPDYVRKNPSPISFYGYSLRHFSVPMSDKLVNYHARVQGWFNDQERKLFEVTHECAIRALTSDSVSHHCLFDQYPESYATDKNALKALNEKPECELKQNLINQLAAGNERARNKKLIGLLDEVSFKSSWTALLVEAEFNGVPLTYDRKGKEWRYGDCKLTNLSDPKANLNTPFVKDYYGLDGFDSKSDVVPILKSISMWQGFESRMSEMWIDEYGYHHPQYTPAGTVTGRSTDKFFLLCPKPKPNIGGTEFLKLIEAKPGYRIVTADFDSQELVLASHMANNMVGSDTQLGTEFAKLILDGDSNANPKTDLHSVMARLVGMDRGLMKNKIYGANYGEGRKARIQGFMVALGVSYAEAVSVNQKFEAAYINGTAKPFFDSLIRQAELQLPTSALLSELPDGFLAAQPTEYVTTRRNRVIQALGSDQTNILICDMDRQINEHQLDAQLIMIRHDEAIYEVEESSVSLFSDLLQQSHRFSVEMILSRLGITEVVERWLYFSSVDVMDRYAESYPKSPTEDIVFA